MRKTSELLWQDVQHQQLFEILELINHADSGPDIVLRLQQYTETHFTLEERYMEAVAYPGMDAHKRAHDVFRDEIATLLESGEEIDDCSRQVISTYLTEWLKRHVFGTDKELEAFILASAVK